MKGVDFLLAQDGCNGGTLTLQGPISHWHVNMVPHAFKRQDSWGSGPENITLQQSSETDHHLHTLAPTHDIHTVQQVCAG